MTTARGWARRPAGLFALVFALASAALGCAPTPRSGGTGAAASPLASWNEGAAKAAIQRLVSNVSVQGSPGYLPASERIAVFDNDGTLWCEQPIYIQFQFALDRVRALAPQHPEWRTREPFNHLLAGDMRAFMVGGDHALAAVIAASHAGLTTDEFMVVVKDWLRTARHPRTGLPYTSMVYQPMLELLDYLRANGFKTYIVSGGGVEFMRAFADSVYGIPPEQVIGSQGKLRFELRDGKPVLLKLPGVEFMDDGPGKAIAIQTLIGRRPVAAFGNSDGDQQMLEWTWAGSGARLCMLIHHTDADREWAYDRSSSLGRLNKALDEASSAGWSVVDMKADWKRVFPAR